MKANLLATIVATQTNATHALEIDGAALRDLKSLPEKARLKLRDAVRKLAIEPRPEDCTPLVEFPGFYRYRVGNYRIIYTIDDNNKLVIVAAFGDRKDIYALLKRRL